MLQRLLHIIAQGHLAKHTIFPCPDPVLGKGVLVQTTLWGNLILGPTARDMHKPEARDMSSESVQEYILSKCKQLVPSFDPRETIHAFAGARAKSDRGDWIVGPSEKNPKIIHVAVRVLLTKLQRERWNRRAAWCCGSCSFRRVLSQLLNLVCLLVVLSPA